MLFPRQMHDEVGAERQQRAGESRQGDQRQDTRGARQPAGEVRDDEPHEGDRAAQGCHRRSEQDRRGQDRSAQARHVGAEARGIGFAQQQCRQSLRVHDRQRQSAHDRHHQPRQVGGGRCREGAVIPTREHAPPDAAREVQDDAHQSLCGEA
ncbi:hypothetical protein WR25_18346 [Diploscapter pachys]|uniref:Uncharacterized protein n=1 Tax=Diploscapter pachys TaxID=2018661 RepID=A0A2A2M219_9BILA|nr:hypothetical protein WR25_18346 [Diploscapter pachys]